MLPALLIAVAMVNPIGIPSSVRAECEEHSKIIEQVKFMQIQGKTVAEVVFEMELEGYEELIEGTFELIITPAELRKRAYATCLRMLEK